MKPAQGYLLAAGLILAGLVLLYSFAWHPVTISVDGQDRRIFTPAVHVSAVLRQAGIATGPLDRVNPPPSAWLLSDHIHIQTASNQLVEASQGVQSIQTTELIPANILALAGERLYPKDLILVDGVESAAGMHLTPGRAHSIQLIPAVSVTLVEDHHRSTFYSSATTLGEALWEEGIILGQADRIQPALETPLSSGLEADLHRARPLVITTQGQTVQATSAAEMVGEALVEASISLQGLDYSVPSEEKQVPEDGRIQVVHVQENIQAAFEFQPYKTEYELDPDTELDTQTVLEPGETGVSVAQLRIRYEDGQEVARLNEGGWSVSQPKEELVGMGMKPVVHTIPGTELEYWRKVTVYATSYSPCRVGGGRCSDHTAIGLPVQRGVAAVTLRWFRDMRLQRIYVPGYGVATIGDTGGGIPGRYWIDLAFSDDDYESWHQWVTIYFLTPVPPYIPYILYP